MRQKKYKKNIIFFAKENNKSKKVSIFVGYNLLMTNH